MTKTTENLKRQWIIHVRYENVIFPTSRDAIYVPPLSDSRVNVYYV